MRFVSPPPAHVPVGSPSAVRIELVDGRGHAVRADQSLTLEDSEAVTAAGGPTRNFAAGPFATTRSCLTRPAAAPWSGARRAWPTSCTG